MTIKLSLRSKDEQIEYWKGLWTKQHELLKNKAARNKLEKCLTQTIEILERWLVMNVMPCRLDHHGICQTHYVSDNCVQKCTTEYLEKIRKTLS